MSYERSFLWLAELLMFFAMACFIRGFRLRKTDLKGHMFWGKLGALVVLVGLLVLEVLMRGAGWEFPVRSQPWLRFHLAAAAVASVSLVTLVLTGILRSRRFHVRVYLIFFPSYALTLIGSLFAFEL